MSIEATTKRAASRSPSRSPKKARVAVDVEALKKQIEYYLSDENLCRDKFFHQRLSEVGWIDLELLLSCKKVQNLNATKDDLIEVISTTSLILNDDKTAVKREAPLPQLAAPSSKASTNQHNGGCVLEISGIPEETNWFAVKRSIEKISYLKVVYATSVDKASGKCAVLLVPFENDLATLSALTSISLVPENPTEADSAESAPQVTLASRVLADAELRETVKKFPSFVIKKREQRARDASKASSKSIELAGYKFPNINAVKKRVSEILKLRKAGSALVANSQDFNLVKAVLELHPKAAEKMRDFQGLKVDKAPKGESHCFFVTRTDGSEEDFSIAKCLASLETPSSAEALPQTTAEEPQAEEPQADVSAE